MTYTYDGTFEGFLTVVFEAYRQKEMPLAIQRPGQRQDSLFEATCHVPADPVKAERVWTGFGLQLSTEGRNNVYQTFLSEQPGVEMLLFRYLRKAFGSHGSIEQQFADDDVMQVLRLGRKVWIEKHRMEAFVRFQKTAGGLFMALIAPVYNVLPLISRHFEERYADQPWVIYDTRRQCGLHYDLHCVQEVRLDACLLHGEKLPAAALDATEEQFQALWQEYFHSVNIPERKNIKLHLRHLPKRYWRYLSEKQPGRR